MQEETTPITRVELTGQPTMLVAVVKVTIQALAMEAAAVSMRATLTRATNLMTMPTTLQAMTALIHPTIPLTEAITSHTVADTVVAGMAVNMTGTTRTQLTSLASTGTPTLMKITGIKLTHYTIHLSGNTPRK